MHINNLTYFGKLHIMYAIVALLFFFAISIIPLALLLCYPMCYRILALCKLQEYSFTRLLCKIIPLETYKPLFDSLQSTYKDKHRYFAGLFFIYRLTFLIMYAFTRGLEMLYFYLELQLLTIIAIHSWAHPHKMEFYNAFWMTILNYQNILSDQIRNHTGTDTRTVQVVIPGIPYHSHSHSTTFTLSQHNLLYV